MAFHILTFLIIHNVPYLEYKPQNDAGTLLNKMLNLDITGFHILKKKKKKGFMVEYGINTIKN